jgi:hypothetical protein
MALTCWWLPLTRSGGRRRPAAAALDEGVDGAGAVPHGHRLQAADGR